MKKLFKDNFIINFFKKIHRHFKRNIIQLRVIILGILMTLWLLLLGGALLSPERQEYSEEELATSKQFPNDSGQIDLVNQIYSKENGIILLQFETYNQFSNDNSAIVPDKLDWTLYAKNPVAETRMEVLPIIDNKISVLIKNVPEDFDTFAVEIVNNTINVQDVDLDVKTIDEVQKEDEKSQSSKQKSSNFIMFMISSKNPVLKHKNLENLSRETFTISEFEKEIKFQNKQIERLTTGIETYNQAIKEEQETIEDLQRESQYLTSDDLAENQKTIQSLESDIMLKENEIEEANANIELLNEKIEALEKKKSDVKSGQYEFSNSIKTIKLDT